MKADGVLGALWTWLLAFTGFFTRLDNRWLLIGCLMTAASADQWGSWINGDALLCLDSVEQLMDPSHFSCTEWGEEPNQFWLLSSFRWKWLYSIYRNHFWWKMKCTSWKMLCLNVNRNEPLIQIFAQLSCYYW